MSKFIKCFTIVSSKIFVVVVDWVFIAFLAEEIGNDNERERESERDRDNFRKIVGD